MKTMADLPEWALRTITVRPVLQERKGKVSPGKTLPKGRSGCSSLHSKEKNAGLKLHVSIKDFSSSLNVRKGRSHSARKGHSRRLSHNTKDLSGYSNPLPLQEVTKAGATRVAEAEGAKAHPPADQPAAEADKI